MISVAPLGAPGQVQDPIALAEIEICGDLMIAASSANVDRLSQASIDEILRVREDRRAAR
ncbi:MULTISPECIES: hypothetical protein [Streptomyces]|uniref:hypothetical protein n=1 Tax=Streptomyces TaxID=1883 RepID=UPI00125016BE|nr:MULTISPECIES: hypothetical protein [Streptomyces]NYV75428.1 hypothetical protein [Streptomyces sp. UH6]